MATTVIILKGTSTTDIPHIRPALENRNILFNDIEIHSDGVSTKSTSQMAPETIVNFSRKLYDAYNTVLDQMHRDVPRNGELNNLAFMLLAMSNAMNPYTPDKDGSIQAVDELHNVYIRNQVARRERERIDDNPLNAPRHQCKP